MGISASIGGSRKTARRIWVRRVKLIPVAFILLLGAGALGVQLRMHVAQSSPSLDLTAFRDAMDKADVISSDLLERGARSLPKYDLSFLKPSLTPVAVPSGAPTGNGRNYESNSNVEELPVPKLEGIMFSETEQSLAVFDNQAVVEQGVVDGWRVVRIEPETVKLICELTGKEKVVKLYEDKKSD